jgi:hypothetical protein
MLERQATQVLLIIRSKSTQQVVRSKLDAAKYYDPRAWPASQSKCSLIDTLLLFIHLPFITPFHLTRLLLGLLMSLEA